MTLADDEPPTPPEMLGSESRAVARKQTAALGADLRDARVESVAGFERCR